MNHQDENKEVVQELKRKKKEKKTEGGKDRRHYGMFGKRGQICAQNTETMANFMKSREKHISVL